MIAVANGQILLLVAPRAFHGRNAPAVGSAQRILLMGVSIVALQRRIAWDMAIPAARVLQHRAHDFECTECAVRRWGWLRGHVVNEPCSQGKRRGENRAHGDGHSARATPHYTKDDGENDADDS